LELFAAKAVNQKAVVHSFGEKLLEENAMVLSASDAVHSFAVGTPQNTGILNVCVATGE
jgi:hypothetical protein